MSDPIPLAVAGIRAWGEARDWRGYDPYDGLNSPAAKALSLGTPLGRRLLVQAVKLSPVNIRPLLRIRLEWNPKALGLVASAYARLAAAEQDESARAEARRWLEWLVANHSGGEAGAAWGYNFDVQTRFFSYARGTPNTIATSFVAHAFLDELELLGEDECEETVRACARFLTTRMLAEGRRGPYFRYLEAEEDLVHNANLLASAVLVRAARLLDKASYLEPAASALATSLAAQSADGSWPYAESPHGRWIDNFHTAYILESLAECRDLVPGASEQLERGVDYWERNLFLEDGTPKYSPERTFPLDAHCYAQAIETWLSIADWRPEAFERAERAAGLLIDGMLDPSGFVYFQRRRLWTSKVPFVRWSTAPAFRALSRLLLAMDVRAPERTGEEAYARLD